MSKEAKCLFITVYILVGLGIIMTYSTSSVYAGQYYQNAQHFLFRQVIYAVIGTAALFFVSSVRVQVWKDYARSIILLSIFFLILVYLPVLGHSAGGASRWLRVGPIHFQPAEYAKVAVCLYLSDYLSRKKKIINKGSITVFFPPLILIGVVCALTLLQPDLGSTAFMLLTVAILFFWAGIRLRYVFIALSCALPVLFLLIMRVPYRMKRIIAYLNPWEDPQGSGFQIIQSFLSFALGGVRGVGLGEGMQKLFYLPSSYNDFVFSVIGEELGMLGAIAVIILYLVILVCGCRMASRAKNDYEKLLMVSLTLFIVLQAVIHMLVTTGLIPTKGLPLPFISYGGTSLVFNLIAVGLLMGAGNPQRGRKTK